MAIIIIFQVDIIIARDPEKEPVAPTAPVSFRSFLDLYWKASNEKVERRKRRKLPMIERPRSAPIYAGQLPFHISSSHISSLSFNLIWSPTASWPASHQLLNVLFSQISIRVHQLLDLCIIFSLCLLFIFINSFFDQVKLISGSCPVVSPMCTMFATSHTRMEAWRLSLGV